MPNGTARGTYSQPTVGRLSCVAIICLNNIGALPQNQRNDLNKKEGRTIKETENKKTSNKEAELRKTEREEGH
jgi:hypothetical protein